MQAIPANDFNRQWEDTRPGVLDAIESVGASGRYVLGPELEGFEQALALFWGHSHAVGVASGLDAIEISLRAAGCKPGDRVLTTPISAFATTLAILKLGSVPVFVDTDERGLIDLDEVEAALDVHPGIEFFVPVHLYGFCLDSDRLAALRDRFGLKVIEDCAQSIGASYNGRASGMVGAFAATSFYPTKNLGALGDGGAVLTSNEASTELVRQLRDYGQTGKYRHDQIGYNSRLDELQAALLLRVYLPRLQAWTERRREIAHAYQAGIHNTALRLPRADAGGCYHLFPVFVANRAKQDFLAHLRTHGIGAGEHYPVAIVEQPALTRQAHECFGDLSRARRLCRTEVSIPIHPYLTDSEIERVIEVCNSWR